MCKLRQDVAEAAREEHSKAVMPADPAQEAGDSTPVVPRLISYGEVLRLGSLALSAIQADGTSPSRLVPSYSGIGPETPVTCLDDDDAARCKHLVARCVRAAGHELEVIKSPAAPVPSAPGGTGAPVSPALPRLGDSSGEAKGTTSELKSSGAASAGEVKPPSMFRSVSVDSSQPAPPVERSVSVAERVRSGSTGGYPSTGDAARSSMAAELTVSPSDGAAEVPLNLIRLRPGDSEAPAMSWDPRLLLLQHSIPTLESERSKEAAEHAACDARGVEGPPSMSYGGDPSSASADGPSSGAGSSAGTAPIAEAAFYKGQRVISLVFTSGSTGAPKGVVETEGRWMLGVLGRVPVEPLVYLSSSPLAHGMDRGMCWAALVAGGRIGFKSSAMSMHQGLCRLNPTVFVAMPHFWSELYEDAKEAGIEAPPSEGAAPSESKDSGSSEPAEGRAASAEQSGGDVKASTTGAPSAGQILARSRLGRRMLLANTGGAPIAPAVQAWCGTLLESKVLGNNYGATECPGISMDGAISQQAELRLRCLEDEDAEEEDAGDEAGDEAGSGARKDSIRGEIMVRSVRNALGYYREPG